MDASKLPKVWSANTYRHSLISKVVGVPVCEKAAYFFSLTFTLHIYYNNVFKIFQIFIGSADHLTPALRVTDCPLPSANWEYSQTSPALREHL